MADIPVPSRVAAFYRATDALDVAGYAAALSDDVVVTFGNLPSVEGRSAASENFASMKASMLSSIGHDVRHAWEDDRAICIEADVTYALQDGRQVKLPCVSVLELDAAGLIAALRMHLDPAPLFASATLEVTA